MADQKQRLRKAMRQCRDALPRQRAQALSQLIQNRAAQLLPYREARAVLLYSAAGNEVATDLLFEDSIRAGRTVYYPVTLPEAHRLEFRAVHSREELAEGPYGIAQPRGGERFNSVAGAIVFVPGLAFSTAGQRLGRGGGFYDRFLASAGPGVIAVGLGYAFQVLEHLPQDPWDWQLDYVVTERAVLDAHHPGNSEAS